jgi:hypothetical protein
VRPALEPVDDLFERLPARRQPVADANWHAGLDGSHDELRRLELAQPLRERARRDLRDRALELGEAKRSSEQRPQDRPRPASADELDRLLK